MSMRASAGRYARALFDVARQESVLDQAERDLASFATMVQSSPELQKVIASPTIPATRKRAVVEELVGRMQPIGPVAKILLMLAERDRLVLLPDLAAIFSDRMMEHRQIIRADVTTAQPLAPEHATQLQRRLANATGRQVLLNTHVDPTLIGGMVARVGGVVYDGSVVSQLQTIRRRLLQGV